MFTTQVAGSYVPLPVLTFAVEYQIFGLNPLPYHISNLIIHLACTLLVFLLLRLLKLDNLFAAFGALLFGIHPMHVESVAWITERKDLLYSLFFIASIILYIYYLNSHKKKLLFYLLSLILFILSLFSKITAVTLPLILLLIDYYVERPFRSNVLIDKIPFFIFSLTFGIAEIILFQRQGVIQTTEIVSIADQVFLGFYALSAYIIKFFAPLQLSAIYPWLYALGHALPLLYYISPLFILFLGFLIYLATRRNRAILFGSLFFLVNIILISQVQVMTQGIAFLADRFTYIPYIGLIFIIGWYIQKIVKNNKDKKIIIFFAMSIVIILFTLQTFNRCKVWENGVKLLSDVIEKYPDQSSRAYYNRGVEYMNMGQSYKATDDYIKAIGIEPKYFDAYLNLGVIYFLQKNYDKAIEISLQGIKAGAQNPAFYDNLGYFYMDKSDFENSISNFQKCLQRDDKNFDATLGLSMVYYYKGNMGYAGTYLDKAKKLEPLLNKGMNGIAELEKHRYSFSDKKKATLKRIFDEVKLNGRIKTIN